MSEDIRSISIVIVVETNANTRSVRVEYDLDDDIYVPIDRVRDALVDALRGDLPPPSTDAVVLSKLSDEDLQALFENCEREIVRRSEAK